MPRSRLYFLLAVCVILKNPNGLAAASEIAESPAFALAPKDLRQLADKESKSITSPAVVLVDDDHWTFQSDGAIERKQHYVDKVLDSSAVQAWSTVQQRWEPWHQERPLVRARVITLDGVSHELDPKTLVDAPAGSNLPQSYSDVRVLQGPLPAVEVGSVVEAELTQKFTPALGSLAFRGYIAGQVPVRFSRITADYPESLPFRYKVSLCPDLKESKEVRNGVVHLSLTFGSFNAIAEADPLLPFDTPRVADVTFSTGASWNDLAIRYGEVIEKQLADAQVADFVKSNAKQPTNRVAVIEDLVHALHRDVRYTGVEFGDAAVVPAKPAETLSRKYGDCKDKAALLVAMLRAAHIPAYVALLNAGLDQDLSPQDPGMGMFNHAIVYVPGSPGLWIDATAEHAQIGSLPPADEGRLALIIKPDTQELTKIPESPSKANSTITTYDYYLPDFGPAHVTQSVRGVGIFDGTYRDLFAVLDNEQFRKQFEEQTQAQWQTKAAVAISHPSVNDFSKPFEFTTDIKGTKTLVVSETSATISFPIATVFSELPTYFATDDSKDAGQKEKKPARTVGFVLPAAFIDRLTCRTHIPQGFALKKLPDDQTVQLGPATYTAHYALKDQILTAEISLDSGKRSYTLDEGNALKKAVLEFAKQPAPMVTFEPVGQTLLDGGHLRQGLDAFRSLAAQHASEAVNHVRLSRAYLATGCGQEARREAETATKMAPAEAVVWRNLAFVYEHDLVGREYKQGWDPSIVETALRKAMSLDPDDLSSQAELARSFSYNAYGADSESLDRVAKAIELFHTMSDDKVEQQGEQDLMIYDLALLGNLDELKSKLDRFGSNGSRAGYRVFLTAVTKSGAKAAADLRASASGDELKQAFLSAAGLLSATGRYQQEADVAAALGLESQLFMHDADLRRLHRVQAQSLHPDSPENLTKCFLSAEFESAENADTLARFWSSSIPPARLHTILQNSQQLLRRQIAQQGMSLFVAHDVLLSLAKETIETNGDSGFRVHLTLPGKTIPMLVVREADGFKLLGNSEISDGVARQALSDLQKGSPETARKWLDWLREVIKIRSEDDPLGGPVFPRLWTKGVAAPASQVRYAAASLVYSKETLPILKEAINSTSETTLKAYYQLAYAGVCVYLKSWSDCVPIAKSLAAAYPASDTALQLLAMAYAGAGQIQDAERTLKAAIANSPDDLALKRVLSSSLALANQLKEAELAAKETTETSNANAIDWNQYGWISLVAGDTDEQKIHAVERAEGQPTKSIENTIAAMYAEIGQLNEARQVTLRTLDSFGYKTPDSSWWYVFGRIAEQLGANSSAILYYQKVEPQPNGEDPLSTYSLARKRLAILNASRAQSSN